jgi:hypothetical protein
MFRLLHLHHAERLIEDGLTCQTVISDLNKTMRHASGGRNVHRLQVMVDILGPMAVSAREAGTRKRTYITLVTAEITPLIAFFEF